MVGLLAMTVGACDSIRDNLGLTKQAPDEFSVVTKAPLILPPDYTLRPPQPGAARPQERVPQEQARAALTQSGSAAANSGQANIGQAGSDRAGGDQVRLPTAAGAPGRTSSGELALLQLAGAADADPSIRRIVNEETSQLVEKDKSFTDRLIFWQTQPPFGTVVNAEKEARRLRDNAAIGKSVTEGTTPTIERKKRAIFEGIF